MNRQTLSPIIPSLAAETSDLSLDRLLAPARHFKHPGDVLSDATLDLQQKARHPVVLGFGCPAVFGATTPQACSRQLSVSGKAGLNRREVGAKRSCVAHLRLFASSQKRRPSRILNGVDRPTWRRRSRPSASRTGEFDLNGRVEALCGYWFRVRPWCPEDSNQGLGRFSNQSAVTGEATANGSVA